MLQVKPVDELLYEQKQNVGQCKVGYLCEKTVE